MSECIIDADDKFAVAKQVRELGEFPLVVLPADKKGGIGNLSFGNLFASIKLHEKIIFTRNLSGMLTAGLSLYRSLEVLRKQSKNPEFSRVLDSILKDINAGGSLSSSMQKFPKVFSTLFVSMVRAGEESGNLPATLTDIGIHLDKSYAMNKKIKGAMTYPMIIFSAMIVIGVLMMIFVIPTLTKTFTDSGAALPASTQLIIDISYFLSHHTLIFLGIVGVLAAGGIALSHVKRAQRIFDVVIIHLPAIGVMVKEINAARTTRTLSSLLSSGVDVTKALGITREVLQNHCYKELIDKTIASVEKGIPMSTLFKERTDLYPIMVGEMIEVGEETGNLAKMLLEIALFYEEEVDDKTKNLSTIVEPVLMVIIGAAVGFFAMAIITPMYSLMSTIN